MTHHFTRVALLLPLVLGACQIGEPTGTFARAITGGIVDIDPANDWAVKLGTRTGPCTGAVIDKFAVNGEHRCIALTAAHCLQNYTVNALQCEGAPVSVGVGRNNSTLVLKEPTNFLIDPGFAAESGNPADTWQHDIAILEFGCDAQQPVVARGELPTAPTPAVWALGWGAASTGGSTSTARRMRSTSVLSGDAAAFTTSGPTLCGGDSGGPAVFWDAAGPVLVGINQSTLGSCQTATQSRFMRVSAFTSWVDQYINNRQAQQLADTRDLCDLDNTGCTPYSPAGRVCAPGAECRKCPNAMNRTDIRYCEHDTECVACAADGANAGKTEIRLKSQRCGDEPFCYNDTIGSISRRCQTCAGETKLIDPRQRACCLGVGLYEKATQECVSCGNGVYEIREKSERCGGQAFCSRGGQRVCLQCPTSAGGTSETVNLASAQCCGTAGPFDPATHKCLSCSSTFTAPAPLDFQCCETVRYDPDAYTCYPGCNGTHDYLLPAGQPPRQCN